MRVQIETLLPYCSTHYWYEPHSGECITVIDSGTEGEYRIIEGIHEGKHILKSDVREL